MIVFLSVSTFVGSVAWAKHYCGTLHIDDGTSETNYKESFNENVFRILTQGEAARMNLDDAGDWAGFPGYRYKEGDTCYRFTDSNQLAENAIKMFNENFDPKKDHLIHGGRGGVPGRCLAGPKKEELNVVFEKYIDCYGGGKTVPGDRIKEWDDYRKEWDALLEDEGKNSE